MFEAYNEALVQLSDEGLKEMYLNFMLIYMGEYTEEVLERCQVDVARGPSPRQAGGLPRGPSPRQAGGLPSSLK